MQNKVVIADKVESLNKKKFKVKKVKDSERDAEIDITAEGDYDVQKLSVDDLPQEMPDKTPIRWFNNFIIKIKGATQPINQQYFVKIQGLGSANVVLVDSNGTPYPYRGAVRDDTIELTDGDPGIGSAP